MAQTSAEVPQTLEELWADFPARDKATPLDTEVLKTWEENDVTLRLVRFNINAFKGEMLKLAGFYAVPKGDVKGLPALVVGLTPAKKSPKKRRTENNNESK